MVSLLEIRDSVQKISEAIASVLNVDVIISDSEFRKIGDTKKHFNLEVKYIKDTYVLGKVIQTGKTVIISSKDESQNCIGCEEKEDCNLYAMICVPIRYEDKVIGAVGLIAIDDESRLMLLNNQNNLIEYVNRMADLIVSKILEKEASEKLTVARNQLLTIMNSIEEGIAAVDEGGKIVYLNSILLDMFSTGIDDVIGKQILDYLPGEYVVDLLEKGISFNNIELQLKRPKGEIHALISGRPVEFGEKNAGSILALKKMEDVYEVINNLTSAGKITSFDEIIGESREIRQLKEKALKVAAGGSNILITGESGTGKELFARAIHYSSNRNAKPFIAINCAAMPETLIESELFGYEDGAFTGAARGGRPGKFQLASGGTIFLDEIGDMPLHLQPKLLRVLQERVVEKIGSHKSVDVDVRLISATNKDLEKMVEQGEFREDLFYRLNVIPLHIPPLRERTGDIQLLLKKLLKQYNAKLGKQIKFFSANAEAALLAYEWRGNVRELANVVEYSANMENSAYIRTASLPHKIRKRSNDDQDSAGLNVIKQNECDLIRNALEQFGSSVNGKRRAANVLGISLATLYRKIKEFHIDES